VDAVRAAAAPHVFSGITMTGEPAILHTRGNEDGHVILRGGRAAPNYDAESVARVLGELRAAGVPERLVIDVSHDNSGKVAERQPDVVADVAGQIAAGNDAIVGLMLESFIAAGRQELGSPDSLVYGQSITDACIGWDTTTLVLDQLAAAVRARRDAH
jgi:3-deoxy-7-phosphoheptulonate synthase